MRRLFGTNGVRGVAGIELTAERAMQIGRATAAILSEGYRSNLRIAVGTDTRISSQMLESALLSGLRSGGADTVTLGVVPTPLVAYLTTKNKLDAGIMISASHNPYEYNGIKIFGRDGFKIPDEVEESIESCVLDNTPPLTVCRRDRFGREVRQEYDTEDYISHLQSAGCSLFGLRVGIDCANGSCYETAKNLFPTLGAECHFIGCEPDGLNINENCGSTSLHRLKELVKSENLDLGIAFDGDGDRCLAVDEKGNEIDGDFIMAIIAKSLKKQMKLCKNSVVGTVMTNLGFVKFCEKEGINYYSAKVGDRYVLEMMEQEGFSFGGEQSGHIIIREYATTGDGQLSAVYLLKILKESGVPLSALASVMNKYPQHHLSLRVSDSEKITFRIDGVIKDLVADAEAKLTDGRLVVRPSGTEPLIRIMTEGEDEVLIKKVGEELLSGIKKRLAQISGKPEG